MSARRLFAIGAIALGLVGGRAVLHRISGRCPTRSAI